MKKNKTLLIFLSTLLFGNTACSTAKIPAPTTVATPTIVASPTEIATLTQDNSNTDYLEKIDANYSKSIAEKLMTFRSNEALGYRTAGSKAEIAASDMLLEEMKKIGLTDTSKDIFTLDGWEFEKAKLNYKDESGIEKNIELGGYATNFDTQGVKPFEILYLEKGTAKDYENIDVTGKLVLIDINQREEWWVNYPAYEASLHGAAAVLVAQDGGYAEISGDALNAQDICGPADAPAFSISRNDANELIKLISKEKKLTVNFDAKSTVTLDTNAFNVVGKIEGKNPDEMIILSAHYDAYFDGFQDDSAAIGLLMGVAKGLVDSEYKPDKTIVFLALAAEEWGVSNTRYDWSTGAYNQIFRVHPEWAGKAIVDMNFELPAYEHTTSDEIRATYELSPFLEEFSKQVPKVDGVYEDGISVVYPLRTWSDDYSFSLAGVPSLRNDFQESPFMRSHYHSQLDNKDTYNEKAMIFHLNMYGLMTIAYDQLAALPLDFTRRFKAYEESLNSDLLEDVSSKEIAQVLEDINTKINVLNKKIADINTNYTVAISNGETDKSDTLLKEGKELNQKTLKLYKFLQTEFVKLTWEDAEIMPHEHDQNNYNLLTSSIDALKKGTPAEATDNFLYAIDNNWYAYDFSKETYQYFTDYTLNQPADRLMWGHGRIMGHIDLYDVIHSILDKTEKGDTDFTSEIKILEDYLLSTRNSFNNVIKNELSNLKTVNAMLEDIN